MFCRYALMLVGLSASFLASVPSRAAVMTLTPVADTYIREQFPSLVSNGSGLSITTFAAFGDRSLIRFDLSGIAARNISSAELTLFVHPRGGGNSMGVPMNIHALTAPWIESQATWLSASTGTPWATPGGFFDPFVYATSNASPGGNQPVTWNITALVEDWYYGAVANNGLLLLPTYFGNHLSFYAADPLNAQTFWPRLTVEFVAVPVPEPSTMILSVVGLLFLKRTASRRAQRSGRQASATFPHTGHTNRTGTFFRREPGSDIHHLAPSAVSSGGLAGSL